MRICNINFIYFKLSKIMSAFMAAAKALKKGGTGSSGATPVNNAKLKCPFDLDEIFKSDTERFG